MTTINEIHFEILGRISYKGAWEQVKIVRYSEYDDGSNDERDIMTFGKYFNGEKECEKFMNSRFFKSCLKAAQKQYSI